VSFTRPHFQASAIDDCYEDLSTRDTPMDRIVVGDVGFGKTEVAMRAVFRVFAGGGRALS
jgi:transcription-repair coupling factor (superfamily II helicase)